MTHRWTLGCQRIETGESLGNDGVRRISAGFRYYLLMPFACVVFVGAPVWRTIVMASCLGAVQRLFR